MRARHGGICLSSQYLGVTACYIFVSTRLVWTTKEFQDSQRDRHGEKLAQQNKNNNKPKLKQ